MPLTAAADERALFAKISWRLLPFLFLLYVVAYLDRVNVSFAGLQMMRDLGSKGLSKEAFGFGGGIFFFGYFLFEIPSNLALVRIGARRWIARIMVSWGIVATAMMFIRGPRSFYALRFLLGLAEAGFFPGMILYLTFWFPAARRARAVAMFMTASAASGVIGSLLSSAILGLNGVLHLAGWKWLFLLEGLPAIAIGLLVLRILPDGPLQAAWLSEEERLLLEEQLAHDNRDGGHRAADLRAAIFTPQTWLLTAVYFTMTLGTYCVSIWLPQLIKAALNLSDRKVTVITGVPYAVAAIGMLLFSHHSDRTRERRGHNSVALFVGAIGASAGAYFHAPAIALVAFSIVTLGIWSSMGPFWSLPPQILAGTAAAAGIALINSVGNLGGFLGSYLVGAIRERTGSFSGALWVLAGFLALGGILVLFVKTESPDQRGFEIMRHS